MVTNTALKSTKTLTEIVQILFMLLHEKPGIVVLSTSAKHLKAWKVDSAVIRIKLETILNASTKTSYMITSLNIIIPLNM